MVLATTTTFDPTLPWELNHRVSLREEAFGALAYHHVTRRLVFLKSPELVTLVRRLHEFASVHSALEATVSDVDHPRYLEALGSLVHSEILSER